ncbi:hypothetical protein IW262DRAFT_967431 [Armillaria fumosa]|nr:hypothetical protein IW262DRAFT_967431 [Armillaria fumosa]
MTFRQTRRTVRIIFCANFHQLPAFLKALNPVNSVLGNELPTTVLVISKNAESSLSSIATELSSDVIEVHSDNDELRLSSVIEIRSDSKSEEDEHNGMPLSSRNILSTYHSPKDSRAFLTSRKESWTALTLIISVCITFSSALSDSDFLYVIWPGSKRRRPSSINRHISNPEGRYTISFIRSPNHLSYLQNPLLYHRDLQQSCDGYVGRWQLAK